MNQKPRGRTSSSEQIIRDIKRKTRKQYSAEEKIRIVLDGLRGEDSILDSILRAEFGNEKYFPEQIWDAWDDVNNRLPAHARPKPVERLKDHVNKPFPAERWLQIGMLQLLTGSHQSFESKAKFATKDMYVLLNAVLCFRNRSQHADGEEMDVGVAVAGLMICLELLGCIDRARNA